MNFLSVGLVVWVCKTYVVHHLLGTGLRCAPPTCVVHQGEPVSVTSANMFHFLVVQKEHAENRYFLSDYKLTQVVYKCCILTIDQGKKNLVPPYERGEILVPPFSVKGSTNTVGTGHYLWWGANPKLVYMEKVWH